LRDFEFIHANRWNTYFVKDIAASRLDDGPGSRLQAALLSELDLQSHDLHRSIFRDSDLLGSFNPRLLQHSATISQSLGTGRAMTVEIEQRRLQVRRTLHRFGFAVVGGLIIIVPMLILMSGVASTKSQAVISVSIFLFAGGVAVLSNTGPENLLVATAAYAAVLVTFFR
jgi:VIT1/CCC1 family predicted Fe2+/Mn2+ transporter